MFGLLSATQFREGAPPAEACAENEGENKKIRLLKRPSE